MERPSLKRQVEQIRGFNRFYTGKIGVLQEGLLKSQYSLAECRILYEIAHRQHCTAAELGRELSLDAGYLSRILRGFEKQELVLKEPSEKDGRQNLLLLTKKGKGAFANLDTTSQEEILALLKELPEAEISRLTTAMNTIQQVLDGSIHNRSNYILRPHQPGDIGWVIHRHGVLYSQEYGWDEHFEALVASIAAKFVQKFNPKRERCWIAEQDGENVGCIFLVEKSKTVGQLRMLLVEPKTRGLGIGKRLVSECIRFARQTGYRRIMLWTNSLLHAARNIYIAEGFQLVHKERHHSFGHDLIGETWELKL